MSLKFPRKFWIFLGRNLTQPKAIHAQGLQMAVVGIYSKNIYTGSGKTLSFIFPALICFKDQILLPEKEGILALTRELCAQIERGLKADHRKRC